MATKAIEEVDEILRSYVDASMDYNNRRMELLRYDFECKCSRCIEEEPMAAIDKSLEDQDVYAITEKVENLPAAINAGA